MSFSILRVPKKAALTVWSGLVVGTSCTLLLLTEDRRRRINQARSAVHNAERIRSSKQYHATVPILEEQAGVAAKDLEDILSSARPGGRKFVRRREEYKDWGASIPRLQVGRIQPDQDTGSKKSEGAPTPSAAEPTREHSLPDPDHEAPGIPDTDAAGREARKARLLIAPHAWGIPFRDPRLSPQSFKQSKQARRLRLPQGSKSSSAESEIIDVNKNLLRINGAADFGDQASLEQAVEILRKTLQKTELAAEDKGSLVQVAIKLSSRCQQAGLMDQAIRALHSAVELGPLAEAEYFAADPQQVIDYAVSVAEAKVQDIKTKGWKDSMHERTLLRKRMDRTIMLLMPKLTEGTLSASRLPQWLPAAKKCMHLAFDLENMLDKAADVYWRIKHLGGDPDGLVLLQFMERLHEHGKLSQIVNTFNLMRHDFVKLNADTWRAVGDLVADAVENAPGQNPEKALINMVEFCPSENCLPLLPLRTTWTTKLLYCHWKRVGNFEEVSALFQRFEELGGFDKIVHKDGMYRTMIQITIEAENWQELDQLIRKLLAVKPSAYKEARIVGLLALAKAKVGDWNAVWDDFKKMEIKDRIEDVFSPVLHEFIKTHTTAEIEDFLKVYIQDLEMPISPFMVNMVANRYGDIRDAQSFIGWLSWCSNKGFEIDAAFGNAILINCRRRWDFSFEDLNHIHRTLQALNPNFVDDVTDNAMVSTGLTAHRKAKTSFLKKQIVFANRKFHRWTIAESAGDMRVDMRHAFSTRDYQKVLFLYRKAKHQKNIPLDEGHLRLAVQASLKFEKRTEPVLRMIKDAKEQDLDVSRVITLVFLVQARQIFRGDTSDKDQLLREVQTCITRFEESGLNLGHQALLRVAFQLLRARHFSGAISFGKSALEHKGITHPDDIPTFQLFLVAYGYRADVHGLKWTLAAAVHLQYYHKRAVYTSLKDAQNFLAKQIQSTDVKKARWVIEKGLDLVRQQRLQMAQDRKELQKATIDIMKRAALEAEHQPTCEEALQRRNAILAELEENVRREEEELARRTEQRKADMQARKEAAEDAELLNLEEAAAMELLLTTSRHEIHGDF